MADDAQLAQPFGSLVKRLKRRDPWRADLLERLRGSVDAGDFTQLWAPHELHWLFDPARIRDTATETIWPRALGFLEFLRNSLVVLPVTVTWLGLERAAENYEWCLRNAATASPLFQTPFLLLWQRGFRGCSSFPPSEPFLGFQPNFSDLLLFNSLIVLSILLLTFVVHGWTTLVIGFSDVGARQLTADLEREVSRLSADMAARRADEPQRALARLVDEARVIVATFRDETAALKAAWQEREFAIAEDLKQRRAAASAEAEVLARKTEDFIKSVDGRAAAMERAILRMIDPLQPSGSQPTRPSLSGIWDVSDRLTTEIGRADSGQVGAAASSAETAGGTPVSAPESASQETEAPQSRRPSFVLDHPGLGASEPSERPLGVSTLSSRGSPWMRVATTLPLAFALFVTVLAAILVGAAVLLAANAPHPPTLERPSAAPIEDIGTPPDCWSQHGPC